jgi:hypothetical protein
MCQTVSFETFQFANQSNLVPILAEKALVFDGGFCSVCVCECVCFHCFFLKIYGSHLFGHALNIDNQTHIQLLALIKLGLCGLSLVSIIPAMVKLCTWQHRLPLHSSFPSWGSWLVIKKHIKACGRRRKCLRCAVCPHYEPANKSLQLTSLRKHARSRAHLDNVHLALGIPREVLDGAPPAEQFGKVIVLNQILAYYVNVLNMKDLINNKNS